MINSGILNLQILSLLARVCHTNALVIADRGFPFWPQIETVDISLVDDVSAVLQVLAAVCGKFAKGLQGSRPNLNRTWNSRSACRVPSG
jgi:D-ribose pyranase